MKSSGLVAAAILLAAVGCGKKEGELAQQPPAEQKPAQEMAQQAQQTPPQAPEAGIPNVAGDTVTTPSGLKYIEVQAGTGVTPQPGQMVFAHYTGWFPDGKPFDSSRQRGQPYPFPLGRGKVIKGWEEAFATMRVGGRRLLIVPPSLAYGERGHPAGIPPNATLIFDVELVDVQSPAPGS